MRMVRPLHEFPSQGVLGLPSAPLLAAAAGLASVAWLVATAGDGVAMAPALAATASWSVAASLFLAGRRGSSPATPEAAESEAPEETAENQLDVGDQLFDGASGLVSAASLKETMRIEIARSGRYGNPLALALFDVQAVTAGDADIAPPPVDFIVETFKSCVRESDVVARLDRTHFAVLLTESGASGCQGFADRLRSALSSAPYAERDGQQFWLKCRAGWSTSLQGHTTVSDYARGALDDLNSRFAQQGWWD